MCVWREVFTIGNDEEGCALEEDELIGLADLAQLLLSLLVELLQSLLSDLKAPLGATVVTLCTASLELV